MIWHPAERPRAQDGGREGALARAERRAHAAVAGGQEVGHAVAVHVRRKRWDKRRADGTSVVPTVRASYRADEPGTAQDEPGTAPDDPRTDRTTPVPAGRPSYGPGRPSYRPDDPCTDQTTLVQRRTSLVPTGRPSSGAGRGLYRRSKRWTNDPSLGPTIQALDQRSKRWTNDPSLGPTIQASYQRSKPRTDRPTPVPRRGPAAPAVPPPYRRPRRRTDHGEVLGSGGTFPRETKETTTARRSSVSVAAPAPRSPGYPERRTVSPGRRRASAPHEAARSTASTGYPPVVG